MYNVYNIYIENVSVNIVLRLVILKKIVSFFIVNNAVQCITLYCFTLMYFVHLCLIGLWFDFLLTVFHWPWPSAVMMVYIGLAGNLCSATACVFFFFFTIRMVCDWS